MKIDVSTPEGMNHYHSLVVEHRGHASVYLDDRRMDYAVVVDDGEGYVVVHPLNEKGGLVFDPITGTFPTERLEGKVRIEWNPLRGPKDLLI